MTFAILTIIAGICFIIYSSEIGDFVGEIDIAEQPLGAGRTYDFIKFIGLIMILLSIWYIGGGMQEFMSRNFSNFF